VIVARSKNVTPDPVAAPGFAAEYQLETMPADEWMKILREGEEY